MERPNFPFTRTGITQETSPGPFFRGTKAHLNPVEAGSEEGQRRLTRVPWRIPVGECQRYRNTPVPRGVGKARDLSPVLMEMEAGTQPSIPRTSKRPPAAQPPAERAKEAKSTLLPVAYKTVREAWVTFRGTAGRTSGHEVRQALEAEIHES